MLRQMRQATGMTVDLAALVADELEHRPDLLARIAVLVAPCMPDASPDRLLTPGEAADRAGVHVETVRRAIRAGRLPAAGQVGRSPRLTWPDITAWLEAGRATTTSRTTRRPRSTTRRATTRPLAEALQEAA